MTEGRHIVGSALRGRLHASPARYVPHARHVGHARRARHASTLAPTLALATALRLAMPVALFTMTALSSACASTPSGGPDAAQQSTAEYDLARDAFQNGRLREALEHVETSLKHDEDNSEAAYLGAILMLAFCAAAEEPAKSSDCRFEEAERYARLALEVSPEMRDAKNTLGVILVHQGRYDEAVDVLKPLANDILYASPEKAWGNLGWAYLMRGNADESIDALRRAIAAQPLFCVGQYRLGLAYEKKEELALAREAFTKAIDTQRPECQKLQDAFDARARVAEKQGLRDEARADLERCRDIKATTRVGQRCAAQLRSLQ